ncbi:hypothetical protein [Prescottella equi]|uniref:hypothetical protein n=1 Tax=Rhodococcus hoagii TaxID=43767 RepID=UPI0027405982|nr:hypothetical protein [Prescottella equi]MDP8016916.1 hypothetical protein [Prescottella equi]
MEPVECDRCGCRVLVVKNSWQHTSVQWTAEARSTCQVLDDAADPVSRARSCPAMQESIVRAAVEGRIGVLDD